MGGRFVVQEHRASTLHWDRGAYEVERWRDGEVIVRLRGGGSGAGTASSG